MNNNIFRQKNIDRINSPESLNNYLSVTNPSVWIILVGIVLLIVGSFVFGLFGEVKTNVPVAVCASGEEITAYVDEADIDRIDTTMKITVEGEEYSIDFIPDRPIKNTEIDEFALHKAGMESSQWLYPVRANGDVKDGVYNGYITVERISPISFVLN